MVDMINWNWQVSVADLAHADELTQALSAYQADLDSVLRRLEVMAKVGGGPCVVRRLKSSLNI